MPPPTETTHVNTVKNNPFGEQFTQREPDAITDEDGDLLYALVRIRKPRFGIETGAGHGTATKRIGEALKANGPQKQSLQMFGSSVFQPWLLSCDVDSEYVDAVKKIVERLPVRVKVAKSTDVLYSTYRVKPEFIFIDAGDAANRLQDVKHIIEHDLLDKKGLLVIHDAINTKYQALVEYVRSQKWDGVVFDGLQGIGVFQHP